MQIVYTILFRRVFQERQPEGHDHRDEGSVESGGRIDGGPEESEHGGTEQEGRADQVEASLTRLQTDYIDLYQVKCFLLPLQQGNLHNGSEIFVLISN